MGESLVQSFLHGTVIGVAAQDLAQFSDALVPLPKMEQRGREVQADSDVFRIPLQRRPILLQGLTQIASLLQSCTLVVELDSGNCILVILVLSAEQIGQLSLYHLGFFRMAVEKERAVKIIQRGLVPRVESHRLLQMG